MASPNDNPPKLRLTEKQASGVIHELMQQEEHHDPAYAEQDRKFKIAAGLGLVVFVLGLILGDQFGSPEVMGLGVVLGIMVFGIALTKASGNYKRAYRRFVTSNMDDDGTFRFCPSCKRQVEPGVGACDACGRRLWRFDPSASAGNPKQAARRVRQIENTADHPKRSELYRNGDAS